MFIFSGGDIIPKKWTKEDNKFILNNYDVLGKKGLMEHFGVSKSSIDHKFERLGITEKSVMGMSYEWTDEQIDYLKENWLYKEDKEIWHELGIDKTPFSHYVVQRKRQQLGLVGKSKRIRKNKEGYKYWIDYDHAVFTHREKIEQLLGRKLTKQERVHHIDGDKSNDDIENLYYCESVGVHTKIHDQLEKLAMKMVQEKIIKFDKEQGVYYCDMLTRTEG